MRPKLPKVGATRTKTRRDLSLSGAFGGRLPNEQTERLERRVRVLENALRWVLADWNNGELGEQTLDVVRDALAVENLNSNKENG